MLVAVWSPKGGSGTSVTAAGLALTAARVGPVRLIDLDGDQPAIFGLASDPEFGVTDWLRAGVGADAEALTRIATPTQSDVALIARGRGDLAGVAPEVGAVLGLAARAPEALTIVDVGSPHLAVARALIELADIRIMVVRGCYLALRRAVHEPLTNDITGVIVVEAAERPLRAREVRDVLQRPVLTSIPERPSIARAVDAGVLATRAPGALTEPLQTAFRRLGLDQRGQAA